MEMLLTNKRSQPTRNMEIKPTEADPNNSSILDKALSNRLFIERSSERGWVDN
jgi:hypothetical protein